MNKKHPENKIFANYLPTEELERTETFLIKAAQSESFREDIHTLKTKRCVSNNSELIHLNPYIDKIVGILRVGGRLQKFRLLEQTETFFNFVID